MSEPATTPEPSPLAIARRAAGQRCAVVGVVFFGLALLGAIQFFGDNSGLPELPLILTGFLGFCVAAGTTLVLCAVPISHGQWMSTALAYMVNLFALCVLALFAFLDIRYAVGFHHLGAFFVAIVVSRLAGVLMAIGLMVALAFSLGKLLDLARRKPQDTVPYSPSQMLRR